MATKLGSNYRLVRRIGRGATGEVWCARDRRGGTVAAKILHARLAGDQRLVERFVGEWRALTELRGPGIVRVLDLVAEGESLALVTELVDGCDLSAVTVPLPSSRAVPLIALVLDALEIAHGRGWVHRDVKPANVLLRSGWEALAPGSVLLSDFGVAALDGGADDLVGTPAYLAPEVLTGGPAGSAVDVYAAGVLLYRLLAGRTPYDGPGGARGLADRHLNAQPPRLLLGGLWETVAAMLAKEPADRPTARQAAARLRASQVSAEALAPQPEPVEWGRARTLRLAPGDPVADLGEGPGAEGTRLGRASRPSLLRRPRLLEALSPCAEADDGRTLLGAAPGPAPAAMLSPPSPTRARRRWPWVGAGVAALVLVITAGGLLRSQPAVSAVVGPVSATYDGRVAAVTLRPAGDRVVVPRVLGDGCAPARFDVPARPDATARSGITGDCVWLLPGRPPEVHLQVEMRLVGEPELVRWLRRIAACLEERPCGSA